MKIISVKDFGDIASGNPVQLPSLEVIADSAILRDGKPFFIPSWASQWSYRPVLAYRVGRLGKNIGCRFAMRYVDAVTVALRVVPEDAVATLRSRGMSTAVAESFDGAVILGNWQPVPQNGAYTIEEESRQAETLPDVEDVLSRSVETVSRYFMLKMGDILLPPVGHTASRPMTMDTGVAFRLNGTEVLRFKIK